MMITKRPDSLFAKEVFFDHTAADGVIKVLVLLKGFESDGTVDLLEIAVPGHLR